MNIEREGAEKREKCTEIPIVLQQHHPQRVKGLVERKVGREGHEFQFGRKIKRKRYFGRVQDR